jgi:hypothetical protein
MCGCAAQRTQTAQMPADDRLVQCDSPALALACEAPITQGQPALYLDRDPRRPGAFAGYDQSTVTYSYLRVDDFYNPDKSGNYNRDSVTERLNVNTR